MSPLTIRNVLVAAIGLILCAAALPLSSCAARGAELDLRPIVIEPEPLGQLRPELRWMTREKIRAIWIGDDLFAKSVEGDRTKSQVIVDAGFNLVHLSMGPNSDDARSGVVDPDAPPKLKHDRSRSTALETRLESNVAEARRVGLYLFVGWKYGTHHLEPYRKFRSPTKGLAKYTCCPLDATYIAGQHVGNWAVQVAQGGADGINLDTEMYHSDTSGYYDPCVCDVCFATYLKEYAANWKAIYDSIPGEERGKWLVDRGALDNLANNWWGDSHYVTFAAMRIEKLWDGIRRRCQAVNPSFVLARYHVFGNIPGMERGMGTSTVPCPVFNASEYNHGPYRGSFLNMKRIAESFPVLYLSGTYITKQPPEMLAESALQGSLYTDGWWAYYGTALLVDGLQSGYGRYEGTSRSDYLDRIATVHAKVYQLLASPKSEWPTREDGKLNWLKATLDKAEAEAAEAPSDETAKALTEAKVNFDNYMKLVRIGGY